MNATSAEGSPELGRWQRPALAAGSVAAVLGILGALLTLRLFLHASVTAYWFWLAIALGCLGVLMIQNLTGGLWGAVVRRPLEAGARTLPQLALAPFKQVYLSVPFFVVRAIAYFAVWIFLERRLSAWSLARDDAPDPAL